MSELTPEALKKLTEKGRAEAVQIIMQIDPEGEPLIDCIDSSPCGDTGDYSHYWNKEKLDNIFGVSLNIEQSPLNRVLDMVECMYWANTGKDHDIEIMRSLARTVIQQIDEGEVDKRKNGALDLLRGWVKKPLAQ